MHANGNAFRTNLSAPDLTEADKYLSRGTWTFPLSQWLFKTRPLSILQTGPVIFINWMLLTSTPFPRYCAVVFHYWPRFWLSAQLERSIFNFCPFSFFLWGFVEALWFRILVSIRDIYSPPLCYTIDFWNFFKNSSEYWKIIISKSRDNKFRRRSNFEFRNARFHGRKSSRRKRKREREEERKMLAECK